jgi:hypothetical protein
VSHSADVEAWLDCGDHGTIALSRVTRRAVFAKSPARAIPPCFADLKILIDGTLLQRRVNLTNGFVGGRSAARAMPVDDAAPF